MSNATETSPLVGPSFSQQHGSTLRAILRTIGFFTLITFLVPAQLLMLTFFPGKTYACPKLFHRCLLGLMGFRIKVFGDISKLSPTLFVANHTSYLDIPVLASLLDASFVAKAEVARWPLIGFLSRLQKTLFIERRTSQAQNHRNELLEWIKLGNSIILFPEGTSTDGQMTLPFKSSLFSIAEDPAGLLQLKIQPVSVTFTALGGMPAISALRPYYAWFGDMTLVDHLWTVFRMGDFTVTVIFHDIIQAETLSDRKQLAATCQQMVSRGIEQSVTGRLPNNITEPARIAPPVA